MVVLLLFLSLAFGSLRKLRVHREGSTCSEPLYYTASNSQSSLLLRSLRSECLVQPFPTKFPLDDEFIHVNEAAYAQLSQGGRCLWVSATEMPKEVFDFIDRNGESPLFAGSRQELGSFEVDEHFVQALKACLERLEGDFRREKDCFERLKIDAVRRSVRILQKAISPPKGR